jgi:thiamine kinase-like enzyme
MQMSQVHFTYWVLGSGQSKCEPYVLTHCDLNLGNIMIQNGKVVC